MCHHVFFCELWESVPIIVLGRKELDCVTSSAAVLWDKIWYVVQVISNARSSCLYLPSIHPHSWLKFFFMDLEFLILIRFMLEMVDKEKEGANFSFAIKILLPFPLGVPLVHATGLKTWAVFAKVCADSPTYFPSEPLVHWAISRGKLMFLIIIPSPFFKIAFEGTRHQQCLPSKAPLSAGSVVSFGSFTETFFLWWGLPLCESRPTCRKEVGTGPEQPVDSWVLLEQWPFLGSSRGAPYNDKSGVICQLVVCRQ